MIELTPEQKAQVDKEKQQKQQETQKALQKDLQALLDNYKMDIVPIADFDPMRGVTPRLVFVPRDVSSNKSTKEDKQAQ